MTKPQIHQVWVCPKCGAKYDSPVKVSSVVCSRFEKHQHTVSMKEE